MVINDRLGSEAMAVRRKHQEIATRILVAMPARDREVLIRYYLDGHAANRIEADLGVTETEFQLIKSSAKARFAQRVDRLAGR